ncbi:unnamed protein product [Moneuplotes crassus]|uniref:Uncharacterized protein n=1 Tax=Euplotes crassus TaxID=5936 RepID=A0AAD1X8C2_EUPCR|nr:unnamed protein product [Moneuplotes crassus]
MNFTKSRILQNEQIRIIVARNCSLHSFATLVKSFQGFSKRLWNLLNNKGSFNDRRTQKITLYCYKQQIDHLSKLMKMSSCIKYSLIFD